ncbi:hypothetical protein V8C34DRAFT_305193 [Trichoderma compactum]
MDALVREPTVGHIEAALKTLPKGLDEIYKRAMERIESQGGGTTKLAKKILSWVVHAKEVLSIVELQHAVAVEPGTSEMNWKFIPTVEIIGTICAGLITIDTQSNAVRLVHYTTQEYFERTHGTWFPNAISNITAICTTYLSFTAFKGGYWGTDEEYEERLRSNPFYKHAALHWACYAREASTCHQNIIKLLECDENLWASNEVLERSQWSRHRGWTRGDDKGFALSMMGVHWAAYLGIEEIMEALLVGREPDSSDGRERSPLWYAAREGNGAVVRLLLDTGRVDVNRKDWSEWTPLLLSSKNGHSTVVKLLLADAGISPD